MTDGVDTLEIGEQRIGEKAAFEEVRSLKDVYAKKAEELRNLVRRQNDIGLNEEERSRRDELERQAGYGLFEQDLTEDRLKTMHEEYEAILEVEKQLRKNPGEVRKRYSDLSKRASTQGLSNSDERKEFARLNDILSSKPR